MTEQQIHNVFQYDGWRPQRANGIDAYYFYKGDNVVFAQRLLNKYLTDLNYLMRVAIRIYTDNKLSPHSDKWVKLHDTIFSTKLDLELLFKSVSEAISEAHSNTDSAEFHEHMVRREYPQARLVNISENPYFEPSFYVVNVGIHKQDRPYKKTNSAWKAVYKSMQFDDKAPLLPELKISEKCSY